MGAIFPFAWLAAAIVLGVIEAASPMLVCIWFCLGAAVTFVVSLFVDSLLVQLVVFVVASFAMLLALRPFMRRRVNARGEQATNADAFCGRVVTVTQAIPAGGCGRALLADTSWAARRADGGALSSGSRARIVSVDGTRLVVEPLPDPASPASSPAPAA